MKVKIIIPLFIIIFLFCESSYADKIHNKAGITSATFLKIGIGARANGMGEAFCAVADDANSIYWNPAGLGVLKNKELSCMYNIWFEEIKHGFLVYVQPFSKWALGCAINYLDVGKIEETTCEYPEGTGKTFGAKDLAVYISCSKKLLKKLSVGGNLKYIHQSIEKEHAAGFGADFGIIYKPSNLSFGLAVQDIGSKLKFIKEGFSLPLNIKAGVAYSYRNFILAVDVNKPIDNNLNFSFGIESFWADIFYLRSGYKVGPNNRLNEQSKVPFGLTAGIGFKVKQFQFDASYLPYGDLGNTYQASFIIRF